jgi:hypothetical protein
MPAQRIGTLPDGELARALRDAEGKRRLLAGRMRGTVFELVFMNGFGSVIIGWSPAPL